MDCLLEEKAPRKARLPWIGQAAGCLLRVPGAFLRTINGAARRVLCPVRSAFAVIFRGTVGLFRAVLDGAAGVLHRILRLVAGPFSILFRCVVFLAGVRLLTPSHRR